MLSLLQLPAGFDALDFALEMHFLQSMLFHFINFSRVNAG